jgi:hypothetical protein
MESGHLIRPICGPISDLDWNAGLAPALVPASMSVVRQKRTGFLAARPNSIREFIFDRGSVDEMRSMHIVVAGSVGFGCDVGLSKNRRSNGGSPRLAAHNSAKRRGLQLVLCNWTRFSARGALELRVQIVTVSAGCKDNGQVAFDLLIRLVCTIYSALVLGIVR